jgi:hypothetical protein
MVSMGDFAAIVKWYNASLVMKSLGFDSPLWLAMKTKEEQELLVKVVRAVARHRWNDVSHYPKGGWACRCGVEYGWEEEVKPLDHVAESLIRELEIK